MITRRILLSGSLAMGASAFAGDRLVVAKRKKRPARYTKHNVAMIERTVEFGPNLIDLPVAIALYAFAHHDDFKHLERSRRPIEIAIPASLGELHQTLPPYDVGYKQQFNHRGYRFVRRKRYGVKVPITGKPTRRIRISAEAIQVGLYLPEFPDVVAPGREFVGKGRPGRWIWLRPRPKKK